MSLPIRRIVSARSWSTGGIVKPLGCAGMQAQVRVIRVVSWVTLSILLGAMSPACSDHIASQASGLPQHSSGDGGRSGSAASDGITTTAAGFAAAGAGGNDNSGGAGSEGNKDSGGHSGAGAHGTGAAAAITCSGSIDTHASPVVLAAHLTCSGSPDVLTAAAGAGTSGWVAARMFDAGSGMFDSFFFHITDSDVTAEGLGTDMVFPLVTSDNAGIPAIAATKKASLDWLSRPTVATTGWSATSVVVTSDPSDQVGDFAIAADGTQYLTARLFTGLSAETVELETRSRAATDFKHTTVVSMPAQSVLSLDATGEPHVSYWLPGRGLFDWQPGGVAAVSILPSTDPSAMPRLHHCRASGGGPFAVAVGLADAVHVVRQRADMAFDDITVPESAPTPSELGSPVPCGTAGCPPPEHQGGEYQHGVALAQTADGSQWLVFVHDHVDREITYTTLGSEQCMCGPTIAPHDDHSSSALVVQRVAPRSAIPSAVVWSLDLGALSSPASAMIDAAAAGSLLHIVLDATPNQQPGLVRYLIVDTAMLD